jgi:FkbM family methyltransferase
MPIQEIVISNKKVEIELENDYYGKEFWKNFEARKYEPDTVSFVEDRVDNNSVFFDIGAANGAITILAAIKGARVLAYEPNPVIFNVLQRNVDLNISVNSRVKVLNCGISNNEFSLPFTQGADATVISDIAVGHKEKDSVSTISILSLRNELERALSTEKVYVKMDIEGAEWRILEDEDCLRSMKKVNATMLLAVHPGFYRPHKKYFRGLNRVSLEIFRIRNFLESLRTYKKLSKYATIQRTNLNPVNNAYLFALLITAGYHEFIIEF